MPNRTDGAKNPAIKEDVETTYAKRRRGRLLRVSMTGGVENQFDAT